MTNKVLVTGASGFIGQRFQSFGKDKYDIVPFSLRTSTLDKIDLTGVTAILHLAVVAHDPTKSDDPVQYEVNVEMTNNLALAAIHAGVPHFIFMSTAKVYGEGADQPLNEVSPCLPQDAYGKSKLIAENLLLKLNSPQFKVAIIRTPLVYGPEVKGNMLRILQLSQKSFPLPFKNSGNVRSMVFIDNLMQLIDTILIQKADGLFIAGDAKPLSTGDLVGLIRTQMNKEERLFSIPRYMKAVLKKLRPSLFYRLFGSFVLDPQSTNQRLNYKPNYSTKEGISFMVKWFNSINNTVKSK